MKQLARRKVLFLLVILTSSCMLFIQCPSTCTPSHLYPTKFQKLTKKPTKDLLRIRQFPSRAAHYVEITAHPPNAGTELSQYTIVATVLVGQGSLRAAVNKINGKLQYNISLEKEINLDKIYLSRGNLEMFKQGKPIKIRCMYQPAAGTQPGEKHELQIKVCAYNSNRQILEQKFEKISFLITQTPKPQEPRTPTPAKNFLSPISNKSGQPRE